MSPPLVKYQEIYFQNWKLVLELKLNFLRILSVCTAFEEVFSLCVETERLRLPVGSVFPTSGSPFCGGSLCRSSLLKEKLHLPLATTAATWGKRVLDSHLTRICDKLFFRLNHIVAHCMYSIFISFCSEKELFTMISYRALEKNTLLPYESHFS